MGGMVSRSERRCLGCRCFLQRPSPRPSLPAEVQRSPHGIGCRPVLVLPRGALSVGGRGGGPSRDSVLVRQWNGYSFASGGRGLVFHEERSSVRPTQIPQVLRDGRASVSEPPDQVVAAVPSAVHLDPVEATDVADLPGAGRP